MSDTSQADPGFLDLQRRSQGLPEATTQPSPEDATFEADVEAAAQSASADLQASVEASKANDTPLDTFVMDPLTAASGGAWKSIFETKDFFMGDTPDEDKSSFRRMVERNTEWVNRKNIPNALLSGVSQFGIGLIGAGKAIKGVEAGRAALGLGEGLYSTIANSGKVGKAAAEIGKAAAVGAVVVDPHEARMSDLLRTFPILDNPVTQYLATDLADSSSEGRFKNALESIGIDLLAIPVLAAGAKALKAMRGGNQKVATQATADLAKAIEASRADEILQDAQAKANAATGTKLPKEMPTAQGGEGAPPPELSRNLAEPPPNASPEEVAALNEKIQREIAAGTFGEDASSVPHTRAAAVVPPVYEPTAAEWASLAEKRGGSAASLAYFDHNNGRVVVNPKLREMAPGKQAIILAHEEGHAMDPVLRLAVVDAGKDQWPLLTAEMEAASRIVRPEHHNSKDFIDLMSGGKGYVDDPSELSADAYALWKTDPAKAAEVMPNYVKLLNDALGSRTGEAVAPKPPVGEMFPPTEKPRVLVQAGDTQGATARPIQKMGDLIADMEGSARAGNPSEPSQGTPPARDAGVLRGADSGGSAPVAAGAAPTEAAPTATAVPNLKAADATLPPSGKVKPLPVFQDYDLAKIMKPLSEDLQALQQHGSRQAASLKGHSFGGGDKLPWQMLKGPEDVEALARRMADYFEQEIVKRKGGATLTDKRLQTLVKQRVYLFGEKPEDIVGLIQTAGKNATSMAANMEAATALGMKMVDEALLVHNKLRVGNLEQWGGDAAAGLNEFAKRVGLSIEMLANARSMLSNSGRTLRRGRGDLPRMKLDELRKLKDLPPQTLFQMFDEANGDMGTVVRMLQKPSLLGKAVDLANFLRVNNLLWGWQTQVVNGVTNLYMLASRPFEKVLGSAVGQATGAIEGAAASSMRVQAVREYRYMTAAFYDAFKLAVRTFMTGDSIIAPHASEYFRSVGRAETNTGALPFRPVNNVGDLAYNAWAASARILGLPTRSLGSADEFVKQLTYRSSVLADASMEADAAGLTGQAYKDFVNARLNEAFDETGAATNPAALQEAKVRTFSQDLAKGESFVGDLGRFAQNAKAAHPALGLILPFVRTPTNVLRYGLNLTPGLNMMQADFRKAITGARGPEAQAQAIGQMTLGALFLGVAATAVEAGMFTGSGPSDSKKRSALMNTGWSPNSVVVKNEDGTTTYMPLNRFDPVAMPFGVLADLMDVAHSAGTPEAEGVEDVAAGLLLAVSNQVKNRTYLLGVSQFLDAVMSPDQKASKFTASLAGSMVPMSSFWRMTSSDPYLREVRTITDGLMANTPGLSDRVPARYDAWGDPVATRANRLTSTVSDSVVDNEMVRMGLDAGYVINGPTPYDAGAGDLRDITLEDGRSAYEAYQQLAGHPKGLPSLKSQVAKLIQSPAYQRATDGDAGTKGTRQWMIRAITGKYREAARKQLRAMSPAFRAKAQEAELKARSALAGQQSPAANRQMDLKGLAQSYGVDLSALLPTPPEQ